MQIVVDRVAGLDVHKDTVMACVRTPGGRGRTQEVQEFSTFTRQLERLRDWLVEQHVTLVVMEATGVYWKPVWHVLTEMGPGVEYEDAASCHDRSRVRVRAERHAPFYIAARLQIERTKTWPRDRFGTWEIYVPLLSPPVDRYH